MLACLGSKGNRWSDLFGLKIFLENSIFGIIWTFVSNPSSWLQNTENDFLEAMFIAFLQYFFI